ncbi:MAG: FecCD family ABC transporter permease [Emergencia timonensis]|uniref:FecCD family ABC transporter permease n=1 Tax=Emergencia timonensis TaxID=1776384 RepID=UPI000829EF2C|nr:iron ABC transporter permease [Emergencia timonensis]WNX90427.1 iron ABC transporter permease [Emergencia timonensis]
MKKRWIAAVIFSLLCVAAVILVCTFFGAADITIKDTLIVLTNKMTGLLETEADALGAKNTIIWDLRFPRSLLAFLVGGALALCGGVYQAIFKNPMADPFVLGISSGAAFGATIGIILAIPASFLGLNTISFFAFGGAILAIFFVYNIAKVGKQANTTSLLLCGIAVNQLLTAVISFAMLLSANQMKKIYFWTLGSFSSKGWDHVFNVLPYIIIGLIVIFLFAKELDIIVLGDETAIRFGIDVEKNKRILFIVTSLVMAACVSVSGIIGFVGLGSPHIVRLVWGPAHKKLLPMSFLLGGIVLCICDTISRSIIASEIPVGIVTAIIGAPFFIYLLRAKNTEVL